MGPSTKADTRSIGRDWATPIIWFGPALVLLLAVTLYPTALVLWLSLSRTRFYDVTGWAGLGNYTAVLTSSAFWDLTFNSLVYVTGSLAIVLPVGLLCALALQTMKRGASSFRAVLLLPWTLSMAVVGCFWLWLLNPSYGPISYAMKSVGLTPGLMLGDPGIALLLLIVVTAWWSFPYVMVMMSAALQSIPGELYEALDIDGGGFWSRLRHVVWPHVNATLGSTALALSILYLTLVTLILVLTGGGPLGATGTWSFEVFVTAFRSVDVSPSAVISIIVLIVNLLLGLVYTRLTGRVSG
ncbi:sugar ABC transporter permease [Bradyrhizobium sp. 61]|uniref:carbohydrate ABC transporter permease n=1 Tax=unclassified Bradyrhizobium TaxID=2631580 RepID=UPI001FF9536C|nr:MULTISPECIES: sugar ABC transporter permease [unclassified Bradyrhizobium]MCK1281828.1 sugar ABC transporter permease [Bradyrhizobium sp. 61]MCK1459725.1 sugar ABC transporter permease [Bradyrhizobium sp. 2]MCK1480833.1 sugar ABC transporter permease [Bradyrhizobium sp. 197]